MFKFDYRAAIANMTVNTDAPIFGAENILVRRRLSSEETMSGALKPAGNKNSSIKKSHYHSFTDLIYLVSIVPIHYANAST